MTVGSTPFRSNWLRRSVTWLFRVALLACQLLVVSADLRSDEAGSAAVSETVLGHRRLAAAYLRTGNADLALIEIEALEQGLAGDARRIATAAREAAEAGELAAASSSITRLRDLLADERRRLGVRILTDCVLEASERLARVDRSRTIRPDLSRPEAGQAIRVEAKLASEALTRCDAEAPRVVVSSPEFRRLVDGARSSLGQIDRAVPTGDADLLYRLLIELRSFDQLLLQRFG